MKQGKFTLTEIEKKPQVILIIFWAIVTFIMFNSMFLFTNQQFTAPIDDSYIYFQYARNLADGYFFNYNKGDGFSSGTTSITYPFVLVPAFWLGLDGDFIALYAFILQSGLTLAAVLMFFRLLLVSGFEKVFALTGALWFCLCGPLMWGMYSGMETGLNVLLLLASLYLGVKSLEHCRISAGYLLVLCAYVLTRPENAVFIILVFFVVVLSGKFTSAQWLKLLIPIGVVFLYFMMIYFLSGVVSTNAQVAKSFIYLPDLMKPWKFLEYVFKTIENYYLIMTGLYFNLQPDKFINFFPVFSGLLFAGGILMAFVNKSRMGSYTGLCVLWLFTGSLVMSANSTFSLYHYRYQMSFLPLYIIICMYCLDYVCKKFIISKRATIVISVILLVFSLPSSMYYSILYGLNCKDIRYMQIDLGKKLPSIVSDGARLAVHDAGAIKFYSRLYTYDFIGLGTNGVAEAHRNGNFVSVIEWFENLSLKSLPEYFVVHPKWYPVKEAGMVKKTLHTQTLQSNFSIVSSIMKLYRIDWGYYRSGNTPVDIGKEAVVIDELDVADIISEKKHDYSLVPLEAGGTVKPRLKTCLTGKKSRQVMDGGYRWTGTERFTMKSMSKKPEKLRVRIAGPVKAEFDLFINGEYLCAWKFTSSSSSFTEQEVKLPGKYRTCQELRFELVLKDSNTAIETYHYWLLK